MRIAESVTFGGSGLDRAAHLRAAARERFATDPNTRFIPFWKGKPLVRNDMLVRVSAGHDVLRDADDDMLFVGIEDGAATFAVRLDRWVPHAVPESAVMDSFLDTSEQIHPAVADATFAELRAIMTRLSPRDAEIAAISRAMFAWHDAHSFCANCGSTSAFAGGGWQRDCSRCARKHFPRTDPVVIMLITNGNDVLLGRSPGWPEKMYSLLAGFVEPGETLEAAVRREVLEETQIEVGPVGYLASQPWPFPASLMFGCHGEATSREITVDPVEIEDAIWMSREELADVFAGLNDRILPARPGAIAHFLLENWLADRLD